jgi:hypothetical protein
MFWGNIFLDTVGDAIKKKEKCAFPFKTNSR